MDRQWKNQQIFLEMAKKCIFLGFSKNIEKEPVLDWKTGSVQEPFFSVFNRSQKPVFRFNRFRFTIPT